MAHLLHIDREVPVGDGPVWMSGSPPIGCHCAQPPTGRLIAPDGRVDVKKMRHGMSSIDSLCCTKYLYQIYR